jgi:hypothetical protein
MNIFLEISNNVLISLSEISNNKPAEVLGLLHRLLDCCIGYWTAASVIGLLHRLSDCCIGYWTAASVIEVEKFKIVQL